MTIYKNIEKFYDWYDNYASTEFGTFHPFTKEILLAELNVCAAVQGGEDVTYELPALESRTGHPETYTFKQEIEEIEPDTYQLTFIF